METRVRLPPLLGWEGTTHRAYPAMEALGSVNHGDRLFADAPSDLFRDVCLEHQQL